MSKSNHDDLADALARLAGGDVAPSEHEPPAPIAPPVPPAPAAPRTVRPASARPAAPRPAPVAAKAPPAPPVAPTPVAPKPVRPPAPALHSPPASPPMVPTNSPPPVIRAVAPVVRKARPAAPTIAPAKPQLPAASPVIDADADGGQSTGISAQADLTEIIDDDDMMSIPAPEASVFQPKIKNVSEMRARAAAARNLELRRTLIPILLTCGVMLGVFAVLKFVSGPDSMLAVAVPAWMPPVLGGFAALFLVMAAVMMMSVKQQLDAMKK
jgi:hypothetical protein